MTISILLAIVLVTWLIGMIAAVVAILFGVLSSSHRSQLAPILAAVAVAIGYLGFGRWTLFRFFPQIGYTHKSDTLDVHIVSSWFFVGPLVLGAVALLMAIWNRRGSCRAA